MRNFALIFVLMVASCTQDRAPEPSIPVEMQQSGMEWRDFAKRLEETAGGVLAAYEVNGSFAGFTLDRPNQISVVYSQARLSPDWSELFKLVAAANRVEIRQEAVDGEKGLYGFTPNRERFEVRFDGEKILVIAR